MQVLGIKVNAPLVSAWRQWLMPARQPYLVSSVVADRYGWSDDRDRLTPELRDTFMLYGIPSDVSLAWLTRAQSAQIPREARLAQPSPHRWPTEDTTRDTARAVRYVESGRRPSRHEEPTAEVWSRAVGLTPGAKEIAGRFAERSGPNCFGTVMAAAGVAGAGETWMRTEPFEEWLGHATRPGGDDDQPGTVFVWRDHDGVPSHAAVTIGGGWLLHKPSQCWMSPIKVLSVAEGKYSARTPGLHLNRRRLT